MLENKLLAVTVLGMPAHQTSDLTRQSLKVLLLLGFMCPSPSFGLGLASMFLICLAPSFPRVPLCIYRIPFTPSLGSLDVAIDNLLGWQLTRSPNYKLCGCSVSRNTLQHKLEGISSTDTGSLFRKVLETYLDWFKNTSLAVLGQAPSARPEGGCKTSDQKSAGI